MNRKIIFLTIALIILIILGIILYFVFIKKGAPNIPVVSDLFPETEKIKNEKDGNEAGKETNIINIKEEGEQKIMKISDNPVAGAAYNQKTNKIKYVDESSGHIYETEPDGKNTERISNTTILNIFNVIWSYDTNNAVFQFIKDNDINNFSAVLNGSSTEGFFLPKDIKIFASSPFENKLAYIEDLSGRGVIFVSDFENKNKKQIYSLPLNNFNISWAGKDALSLSSKPSSSILGYLYSLNLKDKTLQKLAQEEGLNAMWPKDGSKVYITKTGENGLENKILEPQTKKEYELGVKTFAEKCAWSAIQKEIVFCAAPQDFAYDKYPDDWYKGKTTFKDSLYKINYLTNVNEVVLEKELEKHDFDITNPFLSPDEKYLFFINKKDFLLWSVKLD